MALLFARFKKNYDDSKNTTGPQNVTSTALQTPVSGEKEHTIWIAKNDGPQTVFKISDTEIAKELQKWFNDQGKTDDEMLDYMKKLWVAREKNCRTKMRECHNLMKDAIGSNHNILLNCYRQLAALETESSFSFKESIFKDDWAMIQSFETDEPSENLMPPIQHQKYPRFRITDEGTSTSKKGMEYFRRIVKHARIFYTPHSAIRHFKDWREAIREQYGQIKVAIKLLPQPKSFPPLEREKIKQAAQSWIPVLGKPNGAFIKDRDEFIERLSTLQTGNRYFHCELQLLEKFLDAPNICRYIGGSKDSCFMCWSVLARSGTAYTIRGSHSVLYADCAFPFSIQNTKSYSQLVIAVKGIQDHVLEKVLRYAVEDDGAFTLYDDRTESHPAGTSYGALEDRYLEGADLTSFLALTENNIQNKTDSPKWLAGNLESKIIDFIKLPQNGPDPQLVRMEIFNVSAPIDPRRHDHDPLKMSDRDPSFWVTQIQLDTEGPGHGDKRYLESKLVCSLKSERQDLDRTLMMLHRMYSIKGLSERNSWCQEQLKNWPKNPASGTVAEFDFLWRDDIYLFKLIHNLDGMHEFENVSEGEIESLLEEFSEEYLNKLDDQLYYVLLRSFDSSKN